MPHSSVSELAIIRTPFTFALLVVAIVVVVIIVIIVAAVVAGVITGCGGGAISGFGVICGGDSGVFLNRVRR